MPALGSKSPLTAPKEGIDARVGREMGSEAGWLIRRTKEIEELLAQPAIMAQADELARHMERYAYEEDLDVKELDVSLLHTQTKRYITIILGGPQCGFCQGTGRIGKAQDQYCAHCDGSGYR